MSLRVSGVTRVWPWTIRRLGERAHNEAYLAVRAALDRPLDAGREPRHFRVEAVPPVAKALKLMWYVFLKSMENPSTPGCPKR